MNEKKLAAIDAARIEFGEESHKKNLAAYQRDFTERFIKNSLELEGIVVSSQDIKNMIKVSGNE